MNAEDLWRLAEQARAAGQTEVMLTSEQYADLRAACNLPATADQYLLGRRIPGHPARESYPVDPTGQTLLGLPIRVTE